MTGLAQTVGGATIIVPRPEELDPLLRRRFASVLERTDPQSFDLEEI